MPLKLDAYEQSRQKKIAALCRGKDLLDIGYAHMPNPYYRDMYRVGLDLEAAHCPSSYEEEIIGDATKIEETLSGRKFDNVVAGELIEHIENPYEFLRNLRPALKDDGQLIISTPNPLSWPVIFFEMLRSRKFFFTKFHLYYFPPRWVERLLEHSGYKVVRVIPVGLWLPVLPLPCPIWLSYQVIYVAVKHKT